MSIRLNIPSPPEDQEGLFPFLEDAFKDIEASFDKSADGLHEVIHVEPPKPQVGQVVYADGTNFDPSSGEGLYVYKSTGWAFIA